jgi:hypothetical protein
MTHLFGATSKLSTRAPSLVVWILSTADTRVPDSVAPASAAECAILASYGLGSTGQLSLFGHGEFSSKTLKATSRLDSPQSSAIWKRQVIAVRGEYSQRKSAGRATGGSASSSSENWPTPNTSPDAPNMGANRGGGKARARHKIQSLGKASQQWPTPRAEDSESCGNHPGAMDSLTGATRLWGTPTSRDWKDGNCADQDVPTNGLLGRESARFCLDTLPAQTTPKDGAECSKSGQTSRRRLNVLFVEWLQLGISGIGWTDCG